MDEITAEITVSDVAPTIPLAFRTTLSVGAKTDMGRVRDNNEDKHEFFIPDLECEMASRGSIFIVCDGMGGHEAGQIASEVAIKTFIDVYRSHPAQDPETAAAAAVAAANRFVLDVSRNNASRRGMGTTLSALLIVQNRAIVAQVGDSRVYRLRGETLDQLTVDHTWIEETVRNGMLTPEEAEAHPYRHMITRAIGAEDSVIPDVFSFDLEGGDKFLICSDGLTNHVKAEEIDQVLGSDSGPSQMAMNLVTRALVDGGTDNVTALVVRIDGVEALSAG